MVTPQSRCVKVFLMVDQVARPPVRHLHACGICMLAALALVQHVHSGGISMCMVAAYALALVRQMHMCGILWPPTRLLRFARSLALCILQDLHGYGQLQHVP